MACAINSIAKCSIMDIPRNRSANRTSGSRRFQTRSAIDQLGRRPPLRVCGPTEKEFVTSRAQLMKRSTTGLNVRCFNVTIVTGHGRDGKFTGKTSTKTGRHRCAELKAGKP